MAAVHSLGVHTPLALPYFIAEGILPLAPKPDQYRWETYAVQEGSDELEEELLYTQSAVAWSQGKFIRNVYRFNQEGEDVVQAITTRFSDAVRIKAEGTARLTDSTASLKDSTGSSVGSATNDSLTTTPDSFSRALVVLLKTKAHVHFLHGSSHIVDLPFEIEKAFVAPRGLLLQRKRTAQRSLPPTPQVPAAPPNSFFSSQGLPGSSLRFSVSPTFVKSFAKTSFVHRKPPERSQLGGNPKLDALFQDVITSPAGSAEDDVTNLYTMTNPLSELGVVTYSLQHHRPRASGKSRSGLNVEFEGLDPAEHILYISTRDELSSIRRDTASDLILIVTFNADISTVTIWHAWYIDGKSLKTLLKMRADQKAAKARRRSSFISTSMGTGTATPAVRRRDGTRESFAPGQLPLEPHASQGAVLPRKPTRQEEEQAMASQMDPDFLPAGSQTATRENRRISSMNADVRASQTTVSASFAATAGRRATSFGGTHGRRSLSHRKSRGSTPGSAYGHSLGGDDDTMDLDSTIEFDTDESVDEILRHVRATFEASGMDSVFGAADEDFKRELIVRKIHSFHIGMSSSQRSSAATTGSFKIATLAEPLSYVDGKDAKLGVYVHDRSNSQVQLALLRIRHRPIWPQSGDSPVFAVPLLVEESRIDQCEDVLKLRDHKLAAVLLGRDMVSLSLDEPKGFRMPSAAHYRAHDPRDVQVSVPDKEVGKNRTLEAPASPLALQDAGPQATLDHVAGDGIHHRQAVRLRPSNDAIDKLLSVYEIILPKQEARAVRRLWCTAYAWLDAHPESLKSTRCGIEGVAFATTTFLFAVGLLDPKARAALNISKVASKPVDPTAYHSARMHKACHDKKLSQMAVWSWMDRQRTRSARQSPNRDDKSQDYMLVIATALADELSTSVMQDLAPSKPTAILCAVRLMLGLHCMREESKLCRLSSAHNNRLDLAPLVAQLGSWLALEAWSHVQSSYYSIEGATTSAWSFVKSSIENPPHLEIFPQPVGAFQWFEHSLKLSSAEPFPDLLMVARIGTDTAMVASPPGDIAKEYTPRTAALSRVLLATTGMTASPVRTVELLAENGFTLDEMDTFPESVAAAFRESITRCEKQPPTTWPEDLLGLVGRQDLNVSSSEKTSAAATKPHLAIISSTRDVQATCNALDQPPAHARTKEAGRHAISQLIFSEDRRLVEATALMHFNSVQIAQCPKQPEWDEAVHFEQQRRVMHFVVIRMIALPAGDGMIHYDSQTPLLTEKYHLPGFNSSCLMQPMGHTLTTDRSGLTEEKVNWAYFHAGVSSGLRISHNVKGIDTSWIAFNKPNDLTNRHAGLLLALGLGGHLKQLAKWLSFKYLTPKHTMTSVGLLLGLSASYIGTMDGLITRMLSVHITRMLPPGAAELNVSPATQTAGLMGIGMLYHNTQHRRMSEIMISEIEYMEVEDPDSGPDPLRDESYRLAAGFALGLINLGKGSDLEGLHGMKITERLLAVAIGPRPVSAVHVFDRATAGAVMAIALVFLKSGDVAVANKVDIPDTEAQFDQVRPDILMLRAMAKNVILWDKIEARGVQMGTPRWIHDNLPLCYKTRSKQVMEQMLAKHTIDSAHIPLFNVYTGLAWALALKYAGSGNELARDEILELLRFFHRLSEGADAYYFDGKLGRSSLRRCMDVLALCAAMVMAGTGDLETFRYLRRMHGRTDPDTPYGSHLAAHMAIGTLFLGGGTFTFGTSDLAIASLICSFYPLFPTDVHDNRVHLQAFRHLWVFAAEARCIVFEDIDTQRPIHMPITVTLRDGSTRAMKAPCLLPELDTIAIVQTQDTSYWRVTLDFANNPTHLASFRKNQRIFVRRCPAAEAHTSIFSAALAAAQTTANNNEQNLWHNIFKLRAFEELDRADMELVLPPDVHSGVYLEERGTVVDDRLVLGRAVESESRDELWNLRVLLAWAERCEERGGEMRWLGREVVEGLRARLEERGRRSQFAEE